MVNYENSKIYKIVDNTNGNIYIGSTVKTLAQRLGQHRTDFKRFKEGKYHFVKSFEILENDDFDIVLLEKCENINSKEELHARERFYIDSLVCVNKNIPGRTNKEFKKIYNELNKDKLKDYYEKNKERIKEYASEKIICPHCNCEFRRNDKARHEKTKKHQSNLNI